MLVRKSQLKEWLETDICAAVISALKRHLETTYQERSDCFILGEAQRTQETRALLIGSEQTLKDMIEFLEGKDHELMFQDTDIQIVDEDFNGQRIE